MTRARSTIANRWIRLRLVVTGLALGSLLLLIGVRAYSMQVSSADSYRAQADSQHVRTVEMSAPRGAIVDRHGRDLAVTARIESIFANPRAVVDPDGTAWSLADALGLDQGALSRRLATDKYFAWIKRHVTPEEATAVRDLELPGIAFTEEPRRYYPARQLAGPLLGFAGIDGVGLEGIERSMNELLIGRPIRLDTLRDASGKLMLYDPVLKPQAGHSVELSIDRAVQFVAERALLEAVQVERAKAGIAIVIDVLDGSPLALASYPTYDPNRPKTKGSARVRAVTDEYEIGSVMKIFTIGAALEAGAVEIDTGFDIKWGQMRIGRKLIRDSFKDKYLDTLGVFKRSSNVGTIQIARKLGKAGLHDAIVRYGFTRRTGIEVPGERRGFLRPHRRWAETDFAAVSFGHGMRVTPIQLVSAIAALGNDGVMIPPRLIRAVRTADGTLVPREKAEPRRIMDADTAAKVRRMMAAVFDKGKDGGTARSLDVPGYRVGGKTGTAHKWDSAQHAYAADRYVSSFAGLAPIDDPRIAVLVLIDEPQSGKYYGSLVAGPAFAAIVSDSLRILGVPSN